MSHPTDGCRVVCMRNKHETVEFGEVWRKGLACEKTFERDHLEVDGDGECQELLDVDVELVYIEI